MGLGTDDNENVYLVDLFQKQKNVYTYIYLFIYFFL